MKISEITAETVAEYLRLEDSDDVLIAPIMAAAKQYICDETGLNSDELDEHEDISIAFLVLCQDMYDNRSYTDTGSGASGPHAHLVVDSILGHHRVNLI